VCACAAPPARADGSTTDAAAGGALFGEARELMAQGKYAEACAKLDAAKSLLPSAGTFLTLGDCFEKNGQTASAFGAFLEGMLFARKTGDHDREAEGRRRAALLEPRLSKLALQLAPGDRGAGFVLHQNGRAIPEATWGSAVPIDPGEHTIDASSPGRQTWKTVVHVEAKPGTTMVTVPILADAPVLGASTTEGSRWGAQRIAGVVTGGAGIVGLIVGTAFGVLTLKKSSGSKSGGHCDADLVTCDATGLQLQHDARTTANVANVALAVGGAALIGGVVLFVTAPGGAAKAPAASRIKVGPSLGAGSAGLLAEGAW
jgi:serine/threonine-protein kinase